MAERFVLVTVKVATEGRLCADSVGVTCPYLSGEWDSCVLFQETLERDTDAGAWVRRPACLALDGGGVGEPNGVGDGESSAGAT